MTDPPIRALARLDQEEFEHFGVSARSLFSGDHLLQARSYAAGALRARTEIKSCGLPVSPLGDCVEAIFHLTQNQARSNFKRIWADEGEGPPFLTPSEMFFFRPERTRFLSRDMHKLGEMLPQQGTIMMTRSGTAGYPVLVSRTLAEFAISDDAIRILPDSVPIGYVYAFLASEYGQALVTSDQYGATVKHIEAKHVAAMPMPLAPGMVQQHIHNTILRAYRTRDEANSLLDDADEALHRHLELPSFDASRVEYLGPESNDAGLPVPRAFAVASVHLAGRFDASYHVPVVRSIHRRLRSARYPVVGLGDTSADIVVAPRFKRVYVAREYGVPLLQGSHIPQLAPRDLQYISRTETKNLDRWIIHAEWVLVTCSGTTGRVAVSTKGQDGWAASQHILRIIPDVARTHVGYVAAFLMNPYGRHQLTSKIYGGVVDELTAEDTRQVLIPNPPRDVRDEIGDLVVRAFEMRDLASKMEEEAVETIEAVIRRPEFSYGGESLREDAFSMQSLWAGEEVATFDPQRVKRADRRGKKNQKKAGSENPDGRGSER